MGLPDRLTVLCLNSGRSEYKYSPLKLEGCLVNWKYHRLLLENTFNVSWVSLEAPL